MQHIGGGVYMDWMDQLEAIHKEKAMNLDYLFDVVQQCRDGLITNFELVKIIDEWRTELDMAVLEAEHDAIMKLQETDDANGN